MATSQCLKVWGIVLWDYLQVMIRVGCNTIPTSEGSQTR